MIRVTALSREGEKAGIIAFQNDEYYYPLSAARVSGRTVLQPEKHAGPQTGASGVIVSSVPGEAAGRSGSRSRVAATGMISRTPMAPPGGEHSRRIKMDAS